jgi:urea carboxylase
MDVPSPVTGTVWQHACSEGQEVVEGSEIVMMEIMKMELSVCAPCSGRVTWLKPMGEPVQEGEKIATIEEEGR